jgi:hypothetical protein
MNTQKYAQEVYDTAKANGATLVELEEILQKLEELFELELHTQRNGGTP